MSRFTPAVNARYQRDADDLQGRFPESQQGWKALPKKQEGESREWKPLKSGHVHDLHQLDALKVPNYYQERRNTPVARKKRLDGSIALPSIVSLSHKADLTKSATAGSEERLEAKLRHRTVMDEEEAPDETLKSKRSRLLKPLTNSTDHVSIYNSSCLQELEDDDCTNPELHGGALPPPKATLKSVMALQNNFVHLKHRMNSVRPMLFPTSRKQLMRYYRQFRETSKLMQQFQQLTE